MALQNLFGDLALDTTTQTTNELITALTEVTQALQMLVSRQQNAIQPLVSPTGALFVDILTSRAQSPSYPFPIQDTSIYSVSGSINKINTLIESSQNAAANCIYRNITIS